MASAARETVYIETTIPSYLAARTSRDIVVAGNQQLMHEWWQDHKARYDLFISEAVVQEAEKGDFIAAERTFRVACTAGHTGHHGIGWAVSCCVVDSFESCFGCCPSGMLCQV